MLSQTAQITLQAIETNRLRMAEIDFEESLRNDHYEDLADEHEGECYAGEDCRE